MAGLVPGICVLGCGDVEKTEGPLPGVCRDREASAWLRTFADSCSFFAVKWSGSEMASLTPIELIKRVRAALS
jgi:hypothetical protein